MSESVVAEGPVFAVGDRVKCKKGKRIGTVAEIDTEEVPPKRILVNWDDVPEKLRKRYKDVSKVLKLDPETNRPVQEKDNPGAWPGFPPWGNALLFTLEQQRSFVESSAKIRKAFVGPSNEAVELERLYGLTAEQRDSDEGKITIAQSKATPAGVRRCEGMRGSRTHLRFLSPSSHRD
jgi:hypothetical protein